MHALFLGYFFSVWLKLGIRFPDYHPGIKLHIIEDCGHCPHDDVPDAVHAELVPFLLNPM